MPLTQNPLFGCIWNLNRLVLILLVLQRWKMLSWKGRNVSSSEITTYTSLSLNLCRLHNAAAISISFLSLLMLCNMLDLQIKKLKYATVLDTKLDNFSAYSILDKNLSWNLPLTNLDFKNRYISGQLIGTPLFRIPFTSFSIYSFTSENIYGPQILWTLLDFRRIKKPSPLLILQYPFFFQVSS